MYFRVNSSRYSVHVVRKLCLIGVCHTFTIKGVDFLNIFRNGPAINELPLSALSINEGDGTRSGLPRIFRIVDATLGDQIWGFNFNFEKYNNIYTHTTK